ncbi:HEPN domain-containing protein, partial [Candidatus Woesearchaeota archaeon]|nr:HEPN domain-containing protein [Candidatus Woesearchaeota archaeon]
MKGFLIKLAKQDKLKFIEPNENVFLSYSEKSLSNLESARILLDNNKFEEAVSFVYYSMYNLVLALLYKAGIKSENHSASIVLLKKVFGFENKLILEAKTERIDKQYYVGFSVFKKEVQEGIEIAESFNRELKGFISGINRGDIEEYRDKLRDLLKWKKKIKEKMEKKILNFILQEGEGQYIEFKERLGLDFSKEIVAFANSSGGKIFLGVD